MTETPKSAAKKFAIHERRQAALTLRRKGLNLRDIAATLESEYQIKCSYQTVKNDLDAALAELIASEVTDAKALRQLELVRLDGLFESLAPAVDAGDVSAINAALRVAESRRKLLGLDAPVKVAPTTPDGSQPYSDLSKPELIEALVSKLQRGGITPDTEDGGRGGGEAEG